MTIRIGCCTSCLIRYYPLAEALSAMGGLGFRNVEMNISGDGTFPSDMSEAGKKEVRSVIEDNGMSVNLHVDLNYIHRRAVREGKEYSVLFPSLMEPLFAWKDELPVKMVTFDALFGSFGGRAAAPGARPPFAARCRYILRSVRGRKTAAALGDRARSFRREETAGALRYLLEKARGTPLRTGVENYVTGTCTREDLLLLQEAAPGDWGMLLDIGHAHLALARREGKTFQDYLESLPVRIIDVHISDNDGVSDQHLPLGKGKCDLRAALRALTRGGYAGEVMLEITGDNADDAKKELVRSREFIERALSA
ncbi:MAG: sugar phosphate isomerase/epimerase family protein [Endomicrobiales bacterium]